MKWTASILILFIGVSTSVAQTKEEQEVIQISRKKFRWMMEMKLDSLAGILDDRLMFVHSNGWAESKKEFIEDIKSGKLRYVNIDVAESSARIYTNTGIVTGKGKFQVLLDGTELIINLFYTEVYILKDGKWLLASRHSNRLP